MNNRAIIYLTVCFIGLFIIRAYCPPDAGAAPCYPLHKAVTATIFWVGEAANKEDGNISNVASAWDEDWQEHFGGLDDPLNRNSFSPASFTPRENPFYFALPYNDFQQGGRDPWAETNIPWAKENTWGNRESLCKNRWIKIIKGNRAAYAQWQDVGPFRSDDREYVFGTAPPASKNNLGAGLDLSPAVRDYLGLRGRDPVDWQFIDSAEVPDGPWKEIVTLSQITWH
jgi:hypothetical protein